MMGVASDQLECRTNFAMISDHSPRAALTQPLLSRREVLASISLSIGLSGAVATAAAATSSAPPEPTWQNAHGLVVNPRSTWAPAKAAPVENLAVEPSEKVIVVHHSETSNTYAIEGVPKILRSFRSYHTSGRKGWPDVAYNFFVDRFGGVWEGRTGSLAGPVVGSATGGNQGYSQLVCFVGDHHKVPPSDEALVSLTRLLAALGDHYVLPTEAEVTSEFVSLGSTRWPAGTTVRTRTIEGHRAMSLTTCPGDAAFRELPNVRAEVHRIRAARKT